MLGSWLCMGSPSLRWTFFLSVISCWSPMSDMFSSPHPFWKAMRAFCVGIHLGHLCSFIGLTRSFRQLPSLCPNQAFTLVHWLVSHVSSTSLSTPSRLSPPASHFSSFPEIKVHSQCALSQVESQISLPLEHFKSIFGHLMILLILSEYIREV